MSHYPERIVCLTEETTETLYLLGQGRSHRRRFRLHRPSPRGTAETEGLGVHQRALRQDRSAAAGPGARLFRSPGRPRRGTGPARHRRRDVQPAIDCRNPADDPDAGRPGRLSAGCRAARRRSRSRPRADPRGRLAPAAASRVLRRVGRPADLGHPLGGRAGDDRRRRPDLSRAGWRAARRRIASSTHRKSSAAIRRSSSRRGAARRSTSIGSGSAPGGTR